MNKQKLFKMYIWSFMRAILIAEIGNKRMIWLSWFVNIRVKSKV